MSENTTATTSTAKQAKGKGKRTAKPVEVVKGHPNFARPFVKSEADLTPATYKQVLAAGRAAGKAWLDGSDKPLVMMLRAAGVRVAIADKAERQATLAQFRPLVKPTA